MAGRQQQADVAIVGAGITGLALARLLIERGCNVVVLEAGPDVGGAIRTRCIEDRVLEEGPQRTRLTPAVRELVDALGLHDELLRAPRELPLLIYARGRLRRVPLTLGQLRSTELLGVRARARVLLEPFTRTHRPGESVADYLRRRFGADAYEDLLGPLFGGLYASDPASMPAHRTLLPTLRQLRAERSAVLALLRRRDASATPPAISFRQGMHVLTNALYGRVRSAVRLHTRVLSVRSSGAGYAVETATETLVADRVVLTVAAAEAARLLSAVAPDASAALGTLRYNEVAVVHLDAEPGLPAFGYQVSFREPLMTRGVTFNHALFGRERLYTAFLGGARNPDFARRDDDEIAAVATREFNAVMAVDARPINVARAAIPAWDRSWSALDRVSLPSGLYLAANYESRIGIPGRLARAQVIADAIAPAIR